MQRCGVVLRQAQTLLGESRAGRLSGRNWSQYTSEVSKARRKALEQDLWPHAEAAGDLRYTMQSNLAMSVVSAALRNLALELIRITNDLRLLSSGPNTGLAEIALPALQPGSSIMPGKVNQLWPN